MELKATFLSHTPVTEEQILHNMRKCINGDLVNTLEVVKRSETKNQRMVSFEGTYKKTVFRFVAFVAPMNHIYSRIEIFE